MQQMTQNKYYIGVVALAGFLLCCSSFGILYMHWYKLAYSEPQTASIVNFELQQFVKSTLAESCEQIYKKFYFESLNPEASTLKLNDLETQIRAKGPSS